ncbi:winged helix-turn-helix transcriptional regulator [Palleniella muris]|uniref:Winged helix-turn-helix transcriptional regulator n=1 Tax=Palleniella muris TaxID=3038145 RepID=A0AC61QNW7_9BACT|nr:winged helix-turn-helix transcriptional regulator [Palleniella muris]TGX81540.1 winged helix-turn-helix transcriptional regulator [Palleniella muris]
MQEQEEAIVELIQANPYISRKEIARQLDIHESSVKRRLASLQERNVIRRVGAAKGGYWQVIK